MVLKKIEQVKINLREEIKDLLAFENQETAEESKKRGKELRKAVPRSAHAYWEASPERISPITLLNEQEASRVKDLLPIRHERMGASAFAFFRGSALIMASDLSTTPTTGLNVQACGDAHISNFGFFRSAERHLVFDLNDFDETARGPWEWDLKRLVASVEICGRDRGFTEKQRQKAVRAAVESYQDHMLKFSEMSTMDVWYYHTNVEELYAQFGTNLKKKDRAYAEKVINKAKAKDSARAVSKLTEIHDGKLRFVSKPPLVSPVRELIDERLNAPLPPAVFDARKKFIALVLHSYQETLREDRRNLLRQFHGIDVARKVVGVGSVGTRCWIVLLEGLDKNDPLVLQIKEAQDSVLTRFTKKKAYDNNGRRVVEGQRAIQATGDVLLGWTKAKNLDGTTRDYYVRQLWDGKGSIDLDTITPKRLTNLARACGKTLARAHARTGNRFAIAGYLGKGHAFSDALVEFSSAYADQNEKDYQLFLKEYASELSE